MCMGPWDSLLFEDMKLIYFFLILTIGSCSGGLGEGPSEVGFTIVYSVETDLLSRKNSLVIGSGGMVYTTDVDGFAIRKYGATGKLLTRAGSRGEAPGEFTSGPRVISYDAGQVIVAGNLVNRMLHVFNDRLEYLDRYRLKDFPLFQTAHEGAVYLPMMVQNDDGGTHVEVVRRDASGGQSTLFSVGEPIAGLHDMRGLMFSTGSLARDSTVMAYAYNFRNAIEIYSIKNPESDPLTTHLPGNLPSITWQHHSASSQLPGEVSAFLSGEPSAIATMGSAVDQERVFVLGGNLVEGHTQKVFVFDKTGTPVGVVKLPQHAYDIDVRDGILAFLGMNGSLVKLQLDRSAFPSS